MALQCRWVGRRAGQGERVHEDVFVVGPIEDPDVTDWRQADYGSPEEVVGQLLLRRFLERRHHAPLRVHPRHHVLDRAVLACGIKALQDDQQGPTAGRVQLLLGHVQPRREVVEIAVRRLVTQESAARRGPGSQARLFPRLHSEPLPQSVIELHRANVRERTAESPEPAAELVCRSRLGGRVGGVDEQLRAD